MENPNTPCTPDHIIAIGGGGCHIDRASVTFRMVRAKAEDAGIAFHAVHGCTDGSDAIEVLPPSIQEQKIGEITEQIPSHETILLIAQCMGGIALSAHLRRHHQDQPNIRGIIFAPATRPDHVVSHSISCQRRHKNDTIMRLNWLPNDLRSFNISSTYAVDAHLPQSYLREARQSGSELEHMSQLVQQGKLALFSAALDWNTSSPEDIRTLQSTLPSRHLSQLQIIEQAGHSLHTPSILEADPNQRIEQQLKRVDHMLTTGYHLFSNPKALK